MAYIDLALGAIGFTIVSAFLLIAGHLTTPIYSEMQRARWLGVLLLINLAILQGFHYWSLRGDTTLWNSNFYIALLFFTAPLFYFYCRTVLRPKDDILKLGLLAAIPVFFGLSLPNEMMFMASFTIGGLYFLRLGHELFELRSQRKRFHTEVIALLALVIVAGMTLFLGLLMPLLDVDVFFSAFSIMIAMSFLPVLYLLIRYPDFVSFVEEASSHAYAVSTLASVNIERKLEKLKALMLVDKLYMNEGLSLSILADELELSAHQTSELLNNRLGVGFSQYIRQQRIDEAKRQLIENPSASVLSVGMSVGFSAQSGFYTAFKQLEGMTPGQYRKQNKV